jgi:uncharacterized SAM-binding protein YcdF (DUF218 family)
LIPGLLLWTGVAWISARYLETSAEIQHADAIVILSGSALYAERVDWGARLYHEGRAPRVILSNDNQRGGWSNEDEVNLLFYERALRRLHQREVPREKIEVVMPPVYGTYEEVTSIEGYAQAHNLRSLLFVTSSHHSRRTLWTLRKVFHESDIQVGLSTAAPGPNSPSPVTWWLWPRGWRIVAGEYLKMVIYWFRYA